jgi:hypothetical protein
MVCQNLGRPRNDRLNVAVLLFDVIDRRVEDELAAIDHQDVVGRLLDFRDLVRRKENGGSLVCEIGVVRSCVDSMSRSRAELGVAKGTRSK